MVFYLLINLLMSRHLIMTCLARFPGPSRIPRTLTARCVLLRSVKPTPISNICWQSEHFFSPRYHEHIQPHARRVFASSLLSTGPPGDRSGLHCHWNAITTQSIRIISVQARSILPRPEEQSRTCCCQRGSFQDQPQCPGL